MARSFRVGDFVYADRDTLPAALNYALDAYAKVGWQNWATLNPLIRVGTFVRGLPEKPDDATAPTLQLLDVGMAFNPATLDSEPKIEFAWGCISTFLPELGKTLSALRDQTNSSDTSQSEAARTQLASVAQVIQHINVIDETYDAYLKGIWHSLRLAEWIAADFYYAFLVHNSFLAGQERDRYLYPARFGPNIPKAESEDFRDMQRCLLTLRQLRKQMQIDQVKREQKVVSAISIALSALVISQQLSEGRIVPSEQDLAALRYATGLSQQAERNTADVMIRYLDILRREAAEHPILTLLAPVEGTTAAWALARQIEDCVVAAQAASKRLMTSARLFIIPMAYERRSPRDLAECIAAAPIDTVWKLPFFLERATQALPQRNAEQVDCVLGMAAQLDGSGAVRSAAALAGVDVSMMMAPAAGPVGVAIALEWGIIQVIKAVHEYQQLKSLFEASIDPNYLLRGLEHEPASRIGVLLSLVGLIVV